MKKCLNFLLLLFCVLDVNSLPDSITIGGLFEGEDETLEIAFRYAVEKINSMRSLLPKSKLETHIEKLTKGDGFMASQKVCSVLKNGVAAFFGPQSDMTTTTVQSICDTLEIPHIETRWDYRMRREDYSLNLYPHPGTLSEILAEIVEKFDWWTNFAVLYENGDSLARVQNILQLAKKDYRVVSWQLPEGNNYREVLKDIEQSDQFRIILDCSVEILPDVLKQAQQIGMMTYNYEYFITNLDMQIIDYEDFKYSGTNITGIRLLDPNKRDVRSIVSEWKFGAYQKQDPNVYNITENNLKTEAALMYDAVMLFATALTDLDLSNKIDIRPLSCDSNDAWAHGNSLINYMKLVQTSDLLPTLTGRIKFDPEGFRTEFQIDIIKLTPEGFLRIGYWNKGLTLHWPEPPPPDPLDQMVVYNISVRLGLPYFINRTSDTVLTGNDRFEGYVVDLIEKVAKIANFSFNFVPVPDDNYGSPIPGTKDWDGQIGEVLKGNAQIAIGDLTITSSREEVVDFSTPFMNLGISLLFKAKEKQKPELFSFLNPFSVEVWIYMLATYSGVSFVLFILARFTPYEWDNPYPCITDPDSLENNFTLLNSFWFTIGTVMQQGSDVVPRASSTRVVGAMWSFFTLIIISSYTANLAAFLMLEPDISPIDVIEDLPTQTLVQYGCYGGGSTRRFFKEATTPLFQQMYQQMEANPKVYEEDNDYGIERVKNSENYAFFMESTSIDYTIANNCGLRKVVNKLGANLDSKGYGMAVSKGNPLRNILTSAILKLQEEEELENLRKTWWEEKSKVQCDLTATTGGTKALSMSHVGGVFVVLITGMALACLIAIMEFLWNIRNSVKEGRGSFCSELKKDLLFVFQCHGSTKPVRKGDGDRVSNSTSVATGIGGHYNSALQT